MSRRKPRPRRLRLSVGTVELVTARWTRGTMLIRGGTYDKPLVAVIDIESPYEIAAMRRALSKLEKSWQEALGYAREP